MRKVLFVVVLAIWLSADLQGGDWPMWRYDAGHSASSEEQLSEKLHLQWQRQLEAPRRAWTDKSNANIYFDLSYEPVVAGKIMYVGSMNNDSVTAYETESGKEIWRYFTEGPVRFAPVVYKSKVYAASDDGRSDELLDWMDNRSIVECGQERVGQPPKSKIASPP